MYVTVVFRLTFNFQFRHRCSCHKIRGGGKIFCFFLSVTLVVALYVLYVYLHVPLHPATTTLPTHFKHLHA